MKLPNRAGPMESTPFQFVMHAASGAERVKRCTRPGPRLSNRVMYPRMAHDHRDHPSIHLARGTAFQYSNQMNIDSLGEVSLGQTSQLNASCKLNLFEPKSSRLLPY